MANVATLTATLKANTADFDRGMKSAERRMGGFGSAIKNASGAAKLAGAAAGAAVVGFAAKSVSAFASFEKGMNEVFTLLPDISGDAMDQMTEQVKDLSKEMGILPEEVVPALYQAISAGVPRKNVFDFMEVASKAAIGGVTTLEVAVDGLTTATNSYGVENLSAAEAADIMFTTVKLGKTNFEELSSFLFQVAPAAAALGVSFEEVGAAIATITSQGVPARVATTQLRQAMVELGKSGSTAFKAFENATGKTFPQFIAGGGTLQGALGLLAEAAESSGGQITDMFGSVEAAMGATVLVSESGSKKFADALGQMADSTGAVNDAFDTMEDSSARTFDKLGSAFSVVMIEVGERLAPVIGDLADRLIDLAPAIGDLAVSFADVLGPAIEITVGALNAFVNIVKTVVEPFTPTILALDETRDKIEALGQAGSAVALASFVGDVSDLGATLGNAVRPAQTFIGLLGEVEGSAEDAEKALGGINDEILKLTSPMFAAADAARALDEMLLELGPAATRTAEDWQRLAEAQARANATQEAFDNTDQRAQMGALADLLGESVTKARQLGIEWGILDGKKATLTIDFFGQTRGRFPSGQTQAAVARQGGAAALFAGGFIGHEGGVIPGPRGAEVPILAQAGERLVPLGGGGGGGTTVNVNVGGSVISEGDLVEAVRRGLRTDTIRGGSLEFA